MKIQMHDEISNAIGLDRELEVIEVDSKERNDKKELKNYIFPFCMIIRKFRTVMQNGPEDIFLLQLKGKSQSWFRMTMRNFRIIMWNFHTIIRNALGMQNWCWCIFHFAQSCEIVGARAKLLDLVRNRHFITKLHISLWRSLRKTF